MGWGGRLDEKQNEAEISQLEHGLGLGLDELGNKAEGGKQKWKYSSAQLRLELGNNGHSPLLLRKKVYP